MDVELVSGIVELAGQITTIGALAIWIQAERQDNNKLWSIIEKLVSLRLRQIEDDEELTDHKDTLPRGADKTIKS